ncbi:hypothetical protein Efla_004030 [Eimeria flavescens]
MHDTLLNDLTMPLPREAGRLDGEVGHIFSQLTDQQQQEWKANAAAAAAVRGYQQLEGGITSPENKKAAIAEGYKAKQRYQEKQLLLKDFCNTSLGNVLKNQAPLMRREMFRRRLFPIRFEDSARNVEEVQQLLMQRQPIGQLVASLLYLSMLLLFLSCALEVTKMFEAAEGIRSPLMTAVAPTPSAFNAISFLAASGEKSNSLPSEIIVTPETGRPNSILSLKNKASVAWWILHGFIPILYGSSSERSNFGSAVVLGNCFRLTFRQVELQEVSGFDLGYEGVWPISAAGPTSTIASGSLRSENPLTSPPGSRLSYSYPFAATGETKAFYSKGGYYQVVCKGSAEEAQAALQQAQSPSRYPPWIVPAPVIADRRTVSTVVDFFVVNPLTKTFSHCAILFAFTSSGTVRRPLVWVSSLLASSSQDDFLLRYLSLGLMLALLMVYLSSEYSEVKKLGLKVWLKGSWSLLLSLHLLTLLGFLASFAAVQIIACFAPQVAPTISESGNYSVSDGPTAVDEAGFFQLVSDYDYWFYANDVAQQSCAVFGSVTAITGCLLITKLFPALAGAGTKCLQMTFRKVKYFILACSAGMLAILLIFVSFGNISFGTATSSFTGYYESLATSAAFLLGGTLANYDVYDMVAVDPILAGMFFVPLFLIFTVFGFTILTAVVLRKHDFCAQTVEENVIKYKLDEKAVFRTRYEWLKHTMVHRWRAFWKALWAWRGRENLALLDGDDEVNFADDIMENKELKKRRSGNSALRKRRTTRGKAYYKHQHADDALSSEAEYYDSPPQYPSWVWQAMGIEDPFSLHATQGKQHQGFYVDPASMTAYARTYGCFSGFALNDTSGPSNSYFTPNIAATTIPKAPTPSVPKVYVLVRNQMQQDHEDAWKKLFVAAFVLIIIATVALQLTVETAAEMREMIALSFSKTAFPLGPLNIICDDRILGLQDINVKVTFPDREVSAIRTAKDLYEWLVADQGLMAFLAPRTDFSLFGQVFPSLSMPDGSAYQQQVLSNWNSTIAARSVRMTLALREESTFPAQLGFTCASLQCEYQPVFDPHAFREFLRKLVEEDFLRDVISDLTFHIVLLDVNRGRLLSEVYLRFPRNRGGVLSPSISVEAFNLQPYAGWDTTTIAATALQVASLSLFLFFGYSFFVEFHRLRRRLKEEREDFSCCLCLGVFFVDDLFNLFDLMGFGVLACAIGVWALHLSASPHSQVFSVTDDLATAAAAAAAGGSQETEAVQAAAELFDSFTSAAALLRAYAQLSAAILAVAFLRLLRIGRKRKRMTLVFFTLASAAEEMLEILAGTLLVFTGFAFSCFLSFGRHVEGHSTIRNSIISTFLLTMGYFPLSQLFLANAFLAGAFIFPYLFFVGIICSSFFLCVLLRSLAYRSAEIKAMERLGKIENRPIMASLRLFFRELLCKCWPTEDQSQQQRGQQELQHLQHEEAVLAFGNRADSEHRDGVFSSELPGKVERNGNPEKEHRERPLKVVEIPPDAVTSFLSDEQYASLPEGARLFANQEVAAFVDRFRLLMTRLKLSSGNVDSFLKQLDEKAFSDLLTLSRDVAGQEGHLQHALSVYASQVVGGQQKLEAYINFLEQALQNKEEALRLLELQLNLAEREL